MLEGRNINESVKHLKINF